MITKIITYLLDKLIGKYVENFTSNNVRTGLFQGDIRLENLPLKKGVLEDLTECPITVKSGLIGRVTLRIPYTQLRTQAWAIMLEDIYIVAGAGFRRQISSEKEMENEITVKKLVLDSLEAKWRKIINHHTDSTKAEDHSWLSSVASLGYKVLRNIQIEVRNVHIRYEDDESVPSQIFALGLVVDEFSTKSSDFEWNSKNELKADINMVQKFLDLKKIRVYLDPCCVDACENICADNIKNVLDQKLVQLPDSSYVMQPISIHGTMKRHLTPLPIYDQPRILLHLQMQHLELSLTQEQYKTAIVLLNEFDRYDRLKQHIGNRPLETITESPRKWWQFAIKEHMPNIYKGDALSKRARNLVLYVQSYENHLLEKNNDGVYFSDTLDGELEIDVIIELREIAMERAKRRSKEMLSGSVENQPTRQTGWWGYLWGTKTKEIPSPISSPIASSETSQILEKIFPEDTRDGVLDQDISDILNEIDHDATNFFTKDKIFLRGQFSLSGIKIQLLKGVNKPILGVHANNLNVAFETRPSYGSWSIKAALKSLLMQDMSGDDIGVEESPFTDVVSCVNTCNTGDKDIFMLAFEKNPLPLTSALGIKKRLAVTSEPLTIIYCPRLINNVKQYFESIRSNKNIRAVAQKHIRDAKIRTRATLKEMIEKEVAIDKWHILLKISAPKLVLPDYHKLDDGNFNCVVLDLGLLQVSNCDEKNIETLLYGTERKRNPDDSDADDDDFVTPRTSPFGSMDDLSLDVDKPKELTMEPVVDNVYEEYAVVLDNIMVLIGDWCELKTIIARRSVNKRCDIMLMEPFKLQSNLRRKYVRDSVLKHPNIVVETKIQRLLINVSDHKVSMVQGCLNSLTSGIVVTSESAREKPLRYQKGYTQVFDASKWEVTNDRQLLSATFILHALIIQIESDNRPLAELTLTEAQFNMIKYRSKTCIDLRLLSLIMADARANLGPNLDFIVASHKGAHIDPVVESSDVEDPLIAMSYEVTRRRDTRMVHHRASVVFSGLDIIANQETIMELVSFAKNIVTDDSRHQLSKDEETVRNEEMECLDLSVACRSVSVLLINILMDSETATLSAIRVGTISLVDMKVNMVVNDRMLSSVVTIRRIGVHDLSTPDSLHKEILSLTTGTSEINMLSSVTEDFIKIIITKELLSAHYTVTGTIPHFIYVHSPQFIDSVEHCVTECQIYLTRFKNNLTAAARTAILSPQKDDSTNDLQLFKRYHFHLQILSPILVLPRHKTSKDVIIINLGDIDVSNDDVAMCVVFTDATVIARELPISKYQSYDIVICTDTENGFTILNKNNLRLRIVKLTSSGDSTFSGIDINAEFESSLAISLTKNVYEQVLNSLDNIVYEEDEERLSSVVEELSVTEENTEELAIRFRTVWSELRVELYPDMLVACNDPMLRLTLRELSLELVRQNKFIKDIVVEIRYLSLYQILDSAKSKVYQPLLYSTYLQYPYQDINIDISNSCPDLTVPGDVFSGPEMVSTSLPKTTNITITPPPKRKRSRSNSDDLVNNSTLNIKSLNCATDGVMERFVQIRVKLVDKKIPDFVSTFNSVNRFIDANFTDLTCRITTDIWVILLDFFGLGSKFFDPDDIRQLTDVTKVLPSFNRRYDGEIEEIINKKLTVGMKRFDLQLENEVKYPNYENLAGVTVTNLVLNVYSVDGNLDLSGSVEHIQLDDLSPTGAVYPNRLFPASNEQRLLEFRMFKFGVPDPGLLRDEDMCVSVKIQSTIVYIHTQRFLQEINQFVQNFFQYQDQLSHMRVTSAGRIVDKMAPRSSRIRMKVSCQAPLLLIPVSPFSDHILVADLGRFSLCNAFKFPNNDPSQCLLDEMCIELHDMDVYSAIRITNQPLSTDIVLRQVTFRPILPKPLSHKLNLHLTVCRNLDSNISHSSPDWLLHGTLSSVVCNLNVQQYRTIKGVLAHNFGENTDHLNMYRFQAFQVDPSLHTDLTGVVWLGMRIELCLNDVQVNLLSPIISSEESQSIILCRMNYLQSKLSYDSYSDGSKIVELACHDIILEDLRYQSYPVNTRPSVFPVVLSRDNDIIDDQVQASYQLKIQYTTSKVKNKLHIFLNNMKVITIFDWIKATRTWIFTPPYEIISLSNEHENKFDEFAILYVKSMPDLKSMPLHPIAVREHYREIVKEEFKSTNITCDVKESRFFILEKANLSHTNALILTVAGSCAYDTREYRLGIFSFDIPRLHLASCCMTSSSSNLLSIVNPVQIHVVTEEKGVVSKTQPSLDNVLQDNHGPKLAVNVSVSSFKVRLSFCDLQLLATILRSLPSQTTPPANVAHQTESIRHKWSSMSVSESTDTQSTNRPLQTLAKFIENVSFTHLNANDFISICLIDDCIDADVPLFDIKLNNLIINWRLGIIHEATMQTSLSMDYYNINSFGWTPIIEPWPLKFSWKFTNVVELQLKSEEILNIDVSSHLLQIARNTHKKWSEELATGNFDLEKIKRDRSPFVPFVIVNQLGCTFRYTKLAIDKPPSYYEAVNTEEDTKHETWQTVLDSETQTLCFDRETTARDKIRYDRYGMHFNSSHRIELIIDGCYKCHPITVDKLGVFYRDLVTMDSSGWTNDRVRIVVEIVRQGSVQNKIIIRSSLQLHNALNIPLQVRLLGSALEPNYSVDVAPNSKLPIPLSSVYYQIQVRPISSSSNSSTVSNCLFNSPNDFSDNLVSWQVVTNNLKADNEILCPSPKNLFYQGKTSTAVYLICTIERLSFPVCTRSLPGHLITITAPLTIENLLPFDLKFDTSVETSDEGVCKVTNCGIVPASQSCTVLTSSLCQTTQLSIELDNFQRCKKLTIPGNSKLSHVVLMCLYDSEDRMLELQVKVESRPSGPVHITVFASYLIVNRTSLALVYAQAGNLNHPAAGQTLENEKASSSMPFPFSFSNNDTYQLVIRLGNKSKSSNGESLRPNWSPKLSLDKLGTATIQLKAALPDVNRPHVLYNIGLEIRPGKGRHRATTIVILTSRYMLDNRSSYTLNITQYNCVNKGQPDVSITALPKSMLSFHWPRDDFDPLLSVRLLDNSKTDISHWSGGFRIDQTSSFHIYLRGIGDQVPIQLRVTVTLEGARFRVVFTDTDDLPPPYLLENLTRLQLFFSQIVSENNNPKYTVLAPNTKVPYALDEPTLPANVTLSLEGGSHATYNLNTIGPASSLHYENFLYVEVANADQTDNCQLVFDVQPQTKRILLNCKKPGSRSQLWYYSSRHELFHEGSSAPHDPKEKFDRSSENHYLLDVDLIAPTQPKNNQQRYQMKLAKADPRREKFQQWYFTEDGCLTNKLGMKCRVVTVCQNAAVFSTFVPIDRTYPLLLMQDWLRPGSGTVNVSILTDGPTRVLRIYDNEESHKYSKNQTSVAKNECTQSWRLEVMVKLKEVGVFLINHLPEELLYFVCSDIEVEWTRQLLCDCLKMDIRTIQCDNQLMDTGFPCIIYQDTTQPSRDSLTRSAFSLSYKRELGHPYDVHVFNVIHVALVPLNIILEEKLLLKVIQMLSSPSIVAQSDLEDFSHLHHYSNLYEGKKIYIGKQVVLTGTMCLSVITADSLQSDLKQIKKLIPYLMSFANAQIPIEPYNREHVFETSSLIFEGLVNHYRNQLRSQAIKIFGSVDFLGNPIGFISDITSGMKRFYSDQNVSGMIKHFAHGIGDSTAKICNSASRVVYGITLDPDYQEQRQILLDEARVSTSNTAHVKAGFRSFLNGIVGGAVSVPLQSWKGYKDDGSSGLFSGALKGIVGVVTKPVGGILDFATGSAASFREMARSSREGQPQRRYEPRCLYSSWKLLPFYSNLSNNLRYAVVQSDLAKAQALLVKFHKQSVTPENVVGLISIQKAKDSQFRILVSDSFVHIISTTVNELKHIKSYQLCHLATPPVSIDTIQRMESVHSDNSVYIKFNSAVQSLTSSSIDLPSTPNKTAGGAICKCDSVHVAKQVIKLVCGAQSDYLERQMTLTTSA